LTKCLEEFFLGLITADYYDCHLFARAIELVKALYHELFETYAASSPIGAKKSDNYICPRDSFSIDLVPFVVDKFAITDNVKSTLHLGFSSFGYFGYFKKF
jgi:hypothetical protein